jgi:mannose-6-phosphate isomerase-like protein (cupin superfamily)
MWKTIRNVILGALGVLFLLPAQQPTCNHCSASYVPADEIQAYLKRAQDNGLVDQQTRAVDIGKSNIGIGVVYRGKLSTPASDSVAEHDQVSEVYHILDGTATLVTGPEIVDEKRRPADLQTVREFNGPGNSGSSIRNPVAYELKPGDVVVIPAGVGHWFTKIDDHIRYVMVRIDPDKVLPLKDEAASKAYLTSQANQGKGKNKAGKN